MTDEGPGDGGFSLIEVLVAVALLGLAVAAILGGMMTSIISSDVHRKQATGETAVRAKAELVKARAASNYKACPAPADYDAGSVPTGFAASTLVIEYRDASGNWVAACPSATETIQRVTVNLKSDDGRSDESVQFVVRKP